MASLELSNLEVFENNIINTDGIQAVKKLSDNSVHLILSDIPYGIGAEDWAVLHDNTNSAYLGSSPAQRKAGAVFKKRGKPINGWSEADREIPKQYYDWCSTWATDWLRVLKPGGSAIIFAGRRYSHRCIAALEDAGFSYKDMFAWLRQRAPHRAQRLSIVYELIETFENLSILRQKWLEIFQNHGFVKARSLYFQAFWKSLNKFFKKNHTHLHSSGLTF